MAKAVWQWRLSAVAANAPTDAEVEGYVAHVRVMRLRIACATPSVRWLKAIRPTSPSRPSRTHSKGEWTALDERYFTPEDFNGYAAVVRIQDGIWHAMSYAEGGLSAPGANADDALHALERAVVAIEQHLDRIRGGVFAEWRAAVESADWPLFGAFED